MTSNKQIAERFNDCFSRQDWPGMLSLLSEDVERQEVGSPERIRGKKAFEANMRPSPEILSMRGDVTRMTEEGNVVVAEGIVRMSKKDGRAVNIEFCDIFEFEDGKVRRLRSFAAVV